MAGLNRRNTFAAIALPLLFLAMSGLARAATIVVNTLDSGSDPFPLCTLEDAVTAANTHSPINGCAAGTGNDEIVFIVSGTIQPDNTLTIGNLSEQLTIAGPASAGITIDGQFKIQIMNIVSDTSVELFNLTFEHGTSNFGGAIFAEANELLVEGCTFVDNVATLDGGAIFNDGLSEIVNDTFVGNEAGFGGAIFNEDPDSTLTNDTFADNEAEEGAAINSSGEPMGITSSILAGSIKGKNCSGDQLLSAAFTLSDDDSCHFSGSSLNNVANLNLDPTGLENNGGPTQTVALESGSKAIDFVPIAHCIQLFTGMPVTEDQRGFGRPDPGNPNFCDAGAYESGAAPTVALVPNTERVQIARSTSPNADMVNIGLTFQENGAPTCETDQDALNQGFRLTLYSGTCTSNLTGGLNLSLSPFVVHTVNHQSYGTLFQSMPPETVSARMAALPPLPAPSCGQWNLNLEVTGVDTSSLGLGNSNPFALVLTTFDGDFGECFNITNAITGNQIDPPSRKVRRGARR
jgi:hypothetical protein